MRKFLLIVMPVFLLVMTSCKEEKKKEEIHSSEYYSKHFEEAKAKYNFCFKKMEPEERIADLNCSHAGIGIDMYRNKLPVGKWE